MTPATRRCFLHGAFAVGTLLAGCTDRRSEPTAPVPDTEEHVLRDPDHVVLRGSGETPLVELATPDETEPRAHGDEPQSGKYEGLISSRARAERLRITDLDDAEAARRFVRQTDLSSETLGIDHGLVGECYRRELCHVVWSEAEYMTWYLETYRDANVACDEDAHDAMTTLFRVPAVLDPQTIEHSGTGTSRRGCRDPRSSGRDGGDQ